jgi:hypothetical protein
MSVTVQIRDEKVGCGPSREWSLEVLSERDDDQYLCIVPKQTVAAGERVFLPFEGDTALSVILSKAFLLAADTKIADPTIVSQIRR